jgi:uncharacterized protein (TIGR02145 family)
VLFWLSAVVPGVCADFSIAVVGVSGEYRRFFEEKIHETLEKIPNIQVVEAKRELLQKHFKGRRMPHAFPSMILSAIGEEMGVDYVISGHQIDQGYTREKTFLTLRLIQVKNQKNMAWIVNRIPRYPRGYYSKIDVMTYDLISRLANKYPSLRDYAIRDSMVDPRDGQRYKTIRVRDQVIFAENLNFDAGQGSYCYEDDPNNCEKYGRLYTWDAAMAGDSSSNEIPSGVQGVCPEGWHFPSHAELQKLEDYIFYKTEINKPSKFNARKNPIPAWNGNSVYGVPAVDGGYRTSTGEYKYRGRSNHWWSATAGRVGGALSNIEWMLSDLSPIILASKSVFFFANEPQTTSITLFFS